ncbi:zymogen granule protein 16 homolog B-like [Mesocricetus auratus]|uniref:Zymogen granule protein 16 homolog B-like n=1 Tax=Mesocricetus auratus TaxID=10036 RepID=A0ABM2XN54_MESAU|nr:zymogen granule protein 16 homolog B-like [Mesocricetus auratus]
MFQPHAMLLLLILAVLGTPAFSTETYYGTTTGTHFCTSVPEGQNLTGIRMYVRNSNIMGMQMQHGGNWGLLYGYSDGNPLELILGDDESVMSVYGTYGYYIQQLILSTTRPRDMYFGNTRAKNEFADSPQNPSHELLGFCGYFVRGGLRAVLPKWGSPGGSCKE